MAANGTIVTDNYLRTCYPNILACGDAVGPYQLTRRQPGMVYGGQRI